MTGKKTNPIVYFVVGMLSVSLLYQVNKSRSSFDSSDSTVESIRKLLLHTSDKISFRGCDSLTAPELCKKVDSQEFDYKNASQEDPRLIEYIRRQLLHPPSTLEYSLNKPKTVHFSQYQQSLYAYKHFLHGMKGGFFVEVGAYDGEKFSNTLFFERELGWRGLLIEANKDSFKKLLKKHRKAYSINVALSPTKKSGVINFEMDGLGGKINARKGSEIQAIPFFSILQALNVTVVDFFSLDIEGFEVKILRTIPWDKVKFRLMCIEVNHIPEGPDYLKEYLSEKGYRFLKQFGIDMWFGWPALIEETMKS